MITRWIVLAILAALFTLLGVFLFSGCMPVSLTLTLLPESAAQSAIHDGGKQVLPPADGPDVDDLVWRRKLKEMDKEANSGR